MLIRPQMKAAKQQKTIIDALKTDDEVVTTGSVIGMSGCSGFINFVTMKCFSLCVGMTDVHLLFNNFWGFRRVFFGM